MAGQPGGSHAEQKRAAAMAWRTQERCWLQVGGPPGTGLEGLVRSQARSSSPVEGCAWISIQFQICYTLRRELMGLA